MQAFLKSDRPSLSAGTSLSSEDHTGQTAHRRKPPAPWVEKYRPRSINEIVEQKEVVSVLQKCIDGADLPNMLLYGPPGTGKTSIVLAAARQIFGDLYKERILELNASDERGIDVVRSKIKSFAQLTASSIRPDGKPCPPFKIIILDEADSMTHAAQAALRRTMEKESRSTRFCLVCNYVSRIIEPITSRCTKFRFKPLNEDKIIDRLQFICQRECVEMETNAYGRIVEISGGDLRRAITLLQSCQMLKKGGGKIMEDDLLEISGVVPQRYLVEFLSVCRSGNYSKLDEFVQDLSFEAYSIGQVLEQFNEFVLTHPDLSSDQKSVICDKLGECMFRLQEGGSEYLQIMDLGCTTILAFKK
ncbi:unnamed protein product [Hermetia illucens]|uniref:Replication factor C subunit 2 n=1 Tax=Hermetia illucens TaxID=343691 RepID=A0A7R8V6K1_HERIL|nr:replication factor C subunit 4 [Hermetia illucens]CAD7093845.1 unnamed protein product [Hermetia illucens]